MHVPNPVESDPSNPYIQIMFNINSKKVVNNNIVSDRGKQVKFDVREENKEEREVGWEKKERNEKKVNKSKLTSNKGNISVSHKQDNLSDQNPMKPKKKQLLSKAVKPILNGSQTQRSTKNHKKNTSEPLSKLASSQECQLSQKKTSTKSRSKLKSSNHLSSKDTRQKIIELMIRDYERGQISGDNLKVAISSLIERETQQSKLIIRPQSRSEKSRTRIPTSCKNSLPQSLHTTPKNKPSKSKSQKFHYHSYQPSMVLKTHKQPNTSLQQPQIFQRIIQNKQFMSKIIIKGVNSSLFLSNQWTEKESPNKQEKNQRQNEEVYMNIINTSDSVKELKKQMGKLSVKNDYRKIARDIDFGSNVVNMELEEGNYSNNQLIASKLKFQKQNETKNILANFIQQLKSDSKNQFISSGYSLRRQKSRLSSQNSLRYLTRLNQHKTFNIVNNNESLENMQNLQRVENSLDEFCMHEQEHNQMEERESLRIEELQKQYALLLKDRQSESLADSSLRNQSISQYPSIKQKQSKFQSPNKIKSYVSSQLQKKLQKSTPLSQTQQQLNQKRTKSITQNEIKKLNQIMDVIKDQLLKKESLSTNQTNDEDVLNKIVCLLENEKSKIQKELKIYEGISESSINGSMGKIVDEIGFDKKQETIKQQRIEQNQIINSFQKKLKKVNIFQSIEKDKLQKPQKVYFQSSEIRSISSSYKSLVSSNGSTHHLQKVKISELNLDEIQIGLRKRYNDLELQRQQQLSIITEKFINDKISPKQYQEEKEIIEKWFEIQAKELKRTKKNLFEGYKKAKEFLFKEEVLYQTRLTKEKSAKMIKCISEKYLEKLVGNEQNKRIQSTGQEIGVNKRQKSKKPTNTSHLDKKKPSQNSYQTIQQMQTQLLVRNRTPVQNLNVQNSQQENLYAQNWQEEMKILSPLSMQQSRISHQSASLTSYNNQSDPACNNQSDTAYNNQSDPAQVLVKLQECEKSESSFYHDERENERQVKEIEENSECYYEYESVKTKRPYSANKIHNEIQEYLRKYEQIEEENKNEEENCQDDNDTDEVEEELDDAGQHQADGEQSFSSEERQNEEYYGYNQTEEESIDIDKSLPRITHPQNHYQNNNKLPHQSPTSSEQSPLPAELQPLNITIDKPSFQQDEIFSPKKPSTHQQFSQQLLQYNSSSPQKVSLQFTALNQHFNQNFFNLKYLTDEDKDDIFQFMFLDLCLELFLEQTKNNKIMKSIEKYLVYQRRKKKIPKGFKTGLDTCKQYITQIQEYLLNNYFLTLRRLQCPMGPSAKEMLKFMRDYDDTDQTDSQIQTVNLVLPIEIYQTFEGQPINKLQVERYYDDDEKQQSRLKFLKSLKHFHNKAMFDSLNEMLDVERCYGIWGKPFPWKKALDVDRKFDDLTINKKLRHAAQKLIENCSYFCGVLIDKEESVFNKTNISEDYLHHIRQDRMSKMLSNDMIDNEDRWIFYDDEETEVLVSISKSITADLIAQVLKEMKFIAWK